MSDAIAAEDQLAIAALVAEISWRIDSGNPGGVVDLFAEDAELIAPQARIQGAAKIAAFAASSQPADGATRHVVSNLRLSLKADGDVDGTASVLLFLKLPGATKIVAADYTDIYSRRGDRWRVRRREVAPVGAVAGAV